MLSHIPDALMLPAVVVLLVVIAFALNSLPVMNLLLVMAGVLAIDLGYVATVTAKRA
jgi:hypothetical protein